MYWPYILGIAVILYLIGSLRVLRQYERGVVFLLGKFESVRGALTLHTTHLKTANFIRSMPIANAVGSLRTIQFDSGDRFFPH